MASPIANYADLVWYLSQGIAEFERSVTGAILDRLEAACYHHWLRCRLCDGQGALDWAACRRRERREGVRLDMAWLGAVCPDCGGQGGQETTRAVPLTSAEQSLAVHDDAHCSHGPDVRDEVLVRYAHVSRYLGRMPTDLSRVLVAAYEDEKPRQGLTTAAADRLGLAADHPLRNGLAEAVMHARRVDAVHGLLRCDRKMAAGYLWLAESWWNRICGKAVSW